MIYQFSKDTHCEAHAQKYCTKKKYYEIYRASHAVAAIPLFATFKKRLHNSNSANSNIIITVGVVAFCYRSFDNDCCYNGGYYRFEKRAFSIIRSDQSRVRLPDTNYLCVNRIEINVEITQIRCIFNSYIV